MLIKKIAIYVLLLVLFIGIQGCNSILPENIDEPENKDTTDTQVEISAENNEEGEILYDAENINFTGPLTTSFKDEVNIFGIDTAGTSSLFNKNISKLMKWQYFSSLLENILNAADTGTEELIDKNDVFVNEILFRRNRNQSDEKLEKLHEIRLKYKFLEIEYKDKVEIPLTGKNVFTSDMVILYNKDENILELYLDSDDNYIKYSINGFAEEFINWHDDYLKRHTEWVTEGV